MRYETVRDYVAHTEFLHSLSLVATFIDIAASGRLKILKRAKVNMHNTVLCKTVDRKGTRLHTSKLSN